MNICVQVFVWTYVFIPVEYASCKKNFFLSFWPCYVAWDLSSQTRIRPLLPALEAQSLHWTTREVPVGYTSKSGTAESFCNSLLYIFNLLINLFNHLVTLCLICQTVFPKWLYHFTFPLTVYESFIYSHPCQYLVLSVCLIISILVSVK